MLQFMIQTILSNVRSSKDRILAESQAVIVAVNQSSRGRVSQTEIFNSFMNINHLYLEFIPCGCKQDKNNCC